MIKSSPQSRERRPGFRFGEVAFHDGPELEVFNAGQIDEAAKRFGAAGHHEGL